MKSITYYLSLIFLVTLTLSCDELFDKESDTTEDFNPEELKFFFQEKILAGKTLEIQTTMKLLNPQVFLNGEPIDFEIEDNLSNNDGMGSVTTPNEKYGYYLKINIPESYKGGYNISVSAGIADYIESSQETFEVGEVYIYQMADSKDFKIGRPAYAAIDDAILLVETTREDNGFNMNSFPGYKITSDRAEKIKCLDYKREELSDVDIYGFKTISDKYCFSYTTYIAKVDTVYPDYNDFTAIQELTEITYPVIIRIADGLMIPLPSYYDNENSVFSNQMNEAQFRCYEDNVFYFMPAPENTFETINNKPIYKIEINANFFPENGHTFNEESEYLYLENEVDIKQVYDGSYTTFIGEQCHWEVDASERILINDSKMVVNNQVLDISPSNYSGFFTGNPAIFRSPSGTILALKGTSNGPQTEYVSSTLPLKWNVHFQYFRLGSYTLTAVTLSENKMYLIGTDRYYVFDKNNDIDSGQDFSPSVDRFYHYNSLYPHQEHYLYTFKSDALYRIKLSDPSVQEMIYEGLQESDVSYFGVLKDRVVIVDRDMNVIIITDGNVATVDASHLEVWGNPMAIIR